MIYKHIGYLYLFTRGVKMKIWILALVVCSGVEHICKPAMKTPLEYDSYYTCTEQAYKKSQEILFEGDITPDIVDNKRLFTKWSCIPFLKGGEPI